MGTHAPGIVTKPDTKPFGFETWLTYKQIYNLLIYKHL